MTTRRLELATRRFADRTSDRFADLPTTRLVIATIATVTAGAASDGNALVTLSWRGGTVTAAGYAAAYTPVVGHRVHCSLIDDQLFVDYRIVGTP